MNNYDIERHVKGESQFVDDILVPEGLLYASVCYSKIAHGELLNINIKDAGKINGVRGIFTAGDIPGENQIGGIVPDEELFATDRVEFIGQQIAIVVADSNLIAMEAARKIEIEVKELPVITDPREAFKANQLIVPPRTFNMGNVDEKVSSTTPAA